MTKTINEEYAQTVKDCEAMSDKHEEYLSYVRQDLKGASELAQRLEKKAKYNSKITSQEISVLSNYVRQAVHTTEANHHMTEFLLAMMMKLSALGQEKVEIAIDIPKKYEKAMQSLAEYIEASEKARRAYTQ